MFNSELITCERRSFPFADADSIVIFPIVFYCFPDSIVSRVR